MNDVDASFQQLAGLPGEGPAPVQFSSTGQGTHREGFVVQFNCASPEAWVGNFQPGLSAFSTALLHPDGRTIIVISGGQAYQVDPESRTLLGEFGGGISGCIAVPSHSMMVFSDDIRLWGLAPAGIAWRTERISWDGIWRLAVSADHITGEAYDPMRDVWTPFRVHLDSGRVTGGSYAEYFPQPKA